MRVLVELAVGIAFLVNFLLLLGAGRLCGMRANLGRMALAALLAAIHSAACMVSGFAFLANGIWRLVGIGVMPMIAYGWELLALRAGALFAVLSLAMNGIVELINRADAFSATVSVFILMILCLLAFHGRVGPREYVPVSICHGGQKVDLTALVDTGNTLCDPVTGRPVLIADRRAAEKLLGLTSAQLESPVETMAMGQIPGLRLIPYCALGKRSGLLLGMKVDKILMDGKERDLVVAFAPQMLGQGMYGALAGGLV